MSNTVNWAVKSRSSGVRKGADRRNRQSSATCKPKSGRRSDLSRSPKLHVSRIGQNEPGEEQLSGGLPPPVRGGTNGVHFSLGSGNEACLGCGWPRGHVLRQ